MPSSSASVTVVDTLEAVAEMLQQLQGKPQLAVDAEGLNLSRVGKLCLLSLGLPDGRTWLVDVSALGSAALTSTCGGVSVKSLLESPGVVK